MMDRNGILVYVQSNTPPLHNLTRPFANAKRPHPGLSPFSLFNVRFGGLEFPPTVMFKVFLTSGSSSVVYMSGKKMILPASEAAVDACERMGRYVQRLPAEMDW